MQEVVLAVPGDPEQRTGGYLYDRRAFDALAQRGWAVAALRLADSFPFPNGDDLETADTALAAVPTGRLVVIDGLALGAMPEIAARQKERLRLVALVHHPLCLETGLAPGIAAELYRRERRALAAARRVICTSPATARTLIERFDVEAARLEVAVPGVEPALLAQRTVGRGHLVCVGSVIPRKGHLVLIEALMGIQDLAWDLVCVGSLERDPAHAAVVRERVRRHGLEPRVAFLGEVDEATLGNALARVDLLVSASFYEGYGMALSEALARGLPIVAAAGGAVTEAVPEAAALFVPPGDDVALAAALRRALTDLAIRASLKAGALAARRQLTGWGATAAAIEQALHRAMHG